MFGGGLIFPNKRGEFAMVKAYIIEDGQKPTKEQLDEVREAAKREIQFDEDAPELSPAMYKAFRCSAAQRSRRRKNA